MIVKDSTPARVGAASTVDTSRGRMLVLGGNDLEKKRPVTSVDAFVFAKDRWIELNVAGPCPEAGTHPSAVYDAKRDVVYYFGGWKKDADAPTDELWELSLAGQEPLRWKQVNLTPRPPGRNGAAMVLDAKRDRLLLFGGDGGPNQQIAFTPLNDLWAFDLGQREWHRLSTTGDDPKPRWNVACATDDAGRYMFVYGGAGYYQNQQVADSIIYALDMKTLEWSRLGAGSPAPPAVEGTTLTYDTKHSALLVIGGLSLAGEPGPVDLWAFSLKNKAWSKLDARLPSTMRDHVAAYDKHDDRHIVCGGQTAVETGNFYVIGTMLTDTRAIRIPSSAFKNDGPE